MSSRVYRNKDVGKYIRSGEVACCITGSNYAVVNHHIKGEGYGTVRAPDYLQIALTDELHKFGHQHGWDTFEKKYGKTQRQMCAETMAKLHADRVIDLTLLAVDYELPNWLYVEMEKLAYE